MHHFHIYLSQQTFASYISCKTALFFMVSQHRWSLVTGRIILKCMIFCQGFVIFKTGGLLQQWSLKTGFTVATWLFSCLAPHNKSITDLVFNISKYSETCLQRPLPWHSTSLERPHSYSWQRVLYFNAIWPCYQGPPVFRDHIFMANGTVFHKRFYCTCIDQHTITHTNTHTGDDATLLCVIPGVL